MSSAWFTKPLPEVLDFQEGPGIMATDFRNKGVPLVRLAGLKAGAHLLDGCNFLDPVKVSSKWSHFRTEPGDVLLSTSASLGEVAIVRESEAGAIPYTGIVRFRPKGDAVYREFIRFMLVAPDFKEQIEAMGVGSVMRHFGPMHLKKMLVSYPDLYSQRGIAEVLGALDDKIAANSRLITTAETLASSLYRSLSFAVSRPLTNLAHFVNGKAFTKGATGSGRVVVRIAELNSGLGRSTVYNDIDVADQYLARPGDLLFAWSGSLTVRRWYRTEAIINQHIFKVIPKNDTPMWLINQVLQRRLVEFKSIAADKATTMGHIQRRHLEEAVLLPSREDIAKIDPVMASLWQRALAAERETLLLEELRDTLLPNLMSGGLRVRDAEKQVGEVV